MIAAYFDLAYFWRDIGHVMDLGLSDMEEHHRQAERITKARG